MVDKTEPAISSCKSDEVFSVLTDCYLVLMYFAMFSTIQTAESVLGKVST